MRHPRSPTKPIRRLPAPSVNFPRHCRSGRRPVSTVTIRTRSTVPGACCVKARTVSARPRAAVIRPGRNLLPVPHAIPVVTNAANEVKNIQTDFNLPGICRLPVLTRLPAQKCTTSSMRTLPNRRHCLARPV